MSDGKLNLVVQFGVIDKLSGALKNIVGLGRSGDQALRGLSREARDLKGQMANIGREIAGTTDDVTHLVEREKALASQLESVNRKIERQKNLNAANGQAARIAARGEKLKSSGRDNVIGGGAALLSMGLALKGAVEFDGVMADIGIKLGTNDQQTRKLGQQILVAARNSRQLPTTMQLAADKLASIGASASDIPNMLAPIGKVATAYNALPEDLAGAASASITNLGVRSSETGKALALMAIAGKAGKFEIKDMAAQFPMLAASAAALKQKGLGAVADLSAAAQIAAEGVGNDVSIAGNNINNLLLKINAKDTIKNFGKLGVDLPAALRKAYAEGKTPLEAISELTNKALGGNLDNLSHLFGDQQAQQALQQLIPKLERYRALRADIQGRTGEVDADYARKAATSQAGLVALMGNLQRVGITIGGTILPDLVKFSGYLGTAADRVSAFAQAHPTLIRYIVMAAAGMATMRVGLGVLQFAFGGLLGPLATGWRLFAQYRALGSIAAVFPRVASAFGMLRTAALFLGQGMLRAGLMMLANPMVLAIVAIGVAISVVAYLVYRNWDKIKAAFSNGIATVKGWIGALPGWMKSIGSLMMSGLLAAFSPVYLANKLIGMAKGGIAAFKSYLGIKSPSRLFMQMGGHMASGLAIGIDRGGRRPLGAMSRLATGVAGAGALALSGPALASGGAGARQGQPSARPPIAIHIHQQPGEDADALAERIMRKLEQARRRDRLGSFGDDF